MRSRRTWAAAAAAALLMSVVSACSGSPKALGGADKQPSGSPSASQSPSSSADITSSIPANAAKWRFMFGGYNAGEGTIFRAQGVARASKLNERTWPSIESIAPTVPRWRYKETLGYVRAIEENRRRLSQLAPHDSAAP